MLRCICILAPVCQNISTGAGSGGPELRSIMPRLTITLSEERHRAVREAAARRGTTITAIIDESLQLAGVRTRESAEQIVARARANSGLTDAEAARLATRETAAARAGRP